MNILQLTPKDAMVIVDVQNDFLPGGSLPVPGGDQVIPVLNRYIDLFMQRSLPIYATRDWHSPDHSSFTPQGGPWPPHCVAGSSGAEIAPALRLPSSSVLVSLQKDAYSGFEGTGLADQLRARGIERLFIGGLATDYCVLSTVKDALANGFQTILLVDVIRAVDVHPGDGQKAMAEMIERGAEPLRLPEVEGLAQMPSVQ